MTNAPKKVKIKYKNLEFLMLTFYGTFCHQRSFFLTQQKIVNFLNSVDLLQGEKFHTQKADFNFLTQKPIYDKTSQNTEKLLS